MAGQSPLHETLTDLKTVLHVHVPAQLFSQEVASPCSQLEEGEELVGMGESSPSLATALVPGPCWQRLLSCASETQPPCELFPLPKQLPP